MTMVRFAGIRKSFDKRLVLDELSLTVERGEVYGLLGPNGCGKSTAINILSNLLEPDAGTIEIDDRPASAQVTRVLGVCPQEIALYRDLYPAENLRFFATLYGISGMESRQRIDALIRMFGLAPYARTPVSALSGGWQRRVNIAAALVHSPQLLVLDEPTSAVDLEARHELWQMVGALKSSGMTILLTTHHLDEAEQLCSRVGIMKAGRIAREGTIAELLNQVPAKTIAVVETAHQDAIIRRAAEIGWGIRHYAGKIACLLPRQLALQEVVHAFDGIEIDSVGVQRVSLEHAYLEVVHDGQEPASMLQAEPHGALQEPQRGSVVA
jgi:ABC-2 type transport system ATP-binding protein